MPNIATQLSTRSKQPQNLFYLLQQEVHQFRDELESHPIARLCSTGTIPESVLREFVRVQYVESVLWIPMLALIKGRVKSPRLLEAVRANILCEAGYEGVPHVTLCHQFVESVGETACFDGYRDYAPVVAHSVEVMNALAHMNEEEVAGWLMAAETLVPAIYTVFRPAFAARPSVDLRFLDEHIKVDSDEHAEWMNESVQELLQNGASYENLILGIRIAGRVALSMTEQSLKVIIPNRSNRKQPFAFDAVTYKRRNVVERTFCRLKDFRRFATRYDRLAETFMATACLTAIVTYWLK